MPRAFFISFGDGGHICLGACCPSPSTFAKESALGGMLNQTINFGDKISICCERLNSYLFSAGVADARVHVGDPMIPGRCVSKFEQSIFRVQKVAAWGDSNRGAQVSSINSADAVEPVMFGNMIRLQHVPSGFYVHVTRRQMSRATPMSAGESSKRGARVDLRRHFDAHTSVFRLLPRYKIRQEGEKVGAGDHVVLFNELLKLYLIVDAKDESITGGSTQEPFSFHLFEVREAPKSTVLRMLTGILLFHKEQEAFLQLEDGQCVLSHPHIRDSTFNIANLNYSSNAIWLLENPAQTEGGIARGGESFRIKHMATHRYLTASGNVGSPALETVETPEDGDHTLWALVCCDNNDKEVLSSTTFFRIQNVVTGVWLHGNPFSSKEMQV